MAGKGLAVLVAILGLGNLFSVHVDASLGRPRPGPDFARYLIADYIFPGCGGPGTCLNQSIDPELLSVDYVTLNLTENQLKTMCRHARDQTVCHMQHLDCVPENMLSLVDPLKAALTKQWELCDDPNLYTDFQAIKSCAMAVGKRFSDVYASGDYASVRTPPLCPYVALVAGKSAYDELIRIGIFRPPFGGPTDPAWISQDSAGIVKPEEMLHGVCCAGKAFVGCGISTLIRDTCSGDAVTSINRQLDHTFSALNCSAVTAARPCKVAFKF